MPVERIIGLFLDPTYSKRGRSVISNEAILNAGVSKLISKSTALSSNAVENIVIPIFLA